ncbi:hypothetical protein GQ600_11858 [Phytophthora cactorum]|nr:hypothetical protein GQ600_11858 [Phytophthora cactorum]
MKPSLVDLSGFSQSSQLSIPSWRCMARRELWVIPNCRTFKQIIAMVLNVKRGLPCQIESQTFRPGVLSWFRLDTDEAGELVWGFSTGRRSSGPGSLDCCSSCAWWSRIVWRARSTNCTRWGGMLNAQTNEADPLTVLAPVRVEAPHTMVKFNSRELLGLPPGAVIPQDDATGEQFPDQTLTLTCMRFL